MIHATVSKRQYKDIDQQEKDNSYLFTRENFNQFIIFRTFFWVIFNVQASS